MKYIYLIFITIFSVNAIAEDDVQEQTNLITIKQIGNGYESQVSFNLNDPNLVFNIHKGNEPKKNELSNRLAGSESVNNNEESLENEQLGDLNKAIDFANEAQKLANKDENEKALELINKSLEEAPKIAKSLALKGSVLFKLGRTSEAKHSWKQALQQDPSMRDVKSILKWLGDAE